MAGACPRSITLTGGRRGHRLNGKRRQRHLPARRRPRPAACRVTIDTGTGADLVTVQPHGAATTRRGSPRRRAARFDEAGSGHYVLTITARTRPRRPPARSTPLGGNDILNALGVEYAVLEPDRPGRRQRRRHRSSARPPTTRSTPASATTASPAGAARTRSSTRAAPTRSSRASPGLRPLRQPARDRHCGERTGSGETLDRHVLRRRPRSRTRGLRDAPPERPGSVDARRNMFAVGSATGSILVNGVAAPASAPRRRCRARTAAAAADEYIVELSACADARVTMLELGTNGGERPGRPQGHERRRDGRCGRADPVPRPGAARERRRRSSSWSRRPASPSAAARPRTRSRSSRGSRTLVSTSAAATTVSRCGRSTSPPRSTRARTTT